MARFTQSEIKAIKASPAGKLPRFVAGYQVAATKGPRTMSKGATGHPEYYASQLKGPRSMKDGSKAKVVMPRVK